MHYIYVIRCVTKNGAPRQAAGGIILSKQRSCSGSRCVKSSAAFISAVRRCRISWTLALF